MNVQCGQPAYLQVQMHSWKPAGRERPVRVYSVEKLDDFAGFLSLSSNRECLD